MNRSIWLRSPGSAAATVRSRIGRSCVPKPRALTTGAPPHICSACRFWPTTSTKPWLSSAIPATSDNAAATPLRAQFYFLSFSLKRRQRCRRTVPSLELPKLNRCFVGTITRVVPLVWDCEQGGSSNDFCDESASRCNYGRGHSGFFSNNRVGGGRVQRQRLLAHARALRLSTVCRRGHPRRRLAGGARHHLPRTRRPR